MGRQIAVALDPHDEAHFWAHLHAAGDVAVYRSWSPNEKPVDRFVEDRAASPFFIHNRAFHWEPVFERVDYTDRQTGLAGTYYRVVGRHAPLVEYSRHPLDVARPGGTGRLYWAKYFTSQPSDLGYDVAAFDAWFSSLMQWIRKSGRRVDHGIYKVWSLPGACTRLAEARDL